MNRLLIVDDDEDTLLIVTEIARLAGFEPIAASTFPEARDALKKGVGAVLLDIVMPDQLCVRLSAYMAEECSSTPVILMSAGTASFIQKTRTQLEVLGLKVADALIKPFWVDGLLEALSRALSDSDDASVQDLQALLPKPGEH
jgi:DNA-binding NtrC family response regulator